MLEQHGSSDSGDPDMPGPMGMASAAAGDVGVLRIVAGLHAGATRPLAKQEMLVVGSGDDCDIVLADTGVAAHHALITLVNGAFTLRALDAPLRLDGKPLHPGDPAELRPMQRIDLGEAAVALGSADEAAWSALFPAVATEAARARGKPFVRRLPILAAGTVLALTIAAVVVAMLPRGDPQVDAQAFLRSLIPQYRIMDSKTSTGLDGVPALSGMVDDDQTRDRIERQLREAGITATVSLRTGEGMARDVGEVFRAQGVTMQTKYLGHGAVELNGAVDQDTLQRVMDSSAMKDIGVSRFVAGDGLVSTKPFPAPPGGDGKPAPANDEPAVDIVSVVRGKEPYVVDAGGVQYPVGDRVPGHGTLIVIGKQVWVQADDGAIKVLRPVTAAELAARTTAAENADGDRQTASVGAQANGADETEKHSAAASSRGRGDGRRQKL